MDIVARIRERVAHMRPAEQKVAQFIEQNLSFSAHASINELAEKAQVSQASITRLAKALSCKNVRELKLQLAQSIAIGERFIEDRQIDKIALPAIYQSIQEILNLNAGLITDEVCQKAALTIASAPHVLIFGVGGGSTIFAQECQNRLFRLEVKSNAHCDPMLMRMTAATVDKADAIICLSLSGISPDVKDACEIAKEYGAQILAICPQGPLSRIADVHLPIQTKESEYIFAPSTARYAMLAAIDILVSEVAVLNQRKSREKLRRLKHHLDEHRQGHDRLPLGD